MAETDRSTATAVTVAAIQPELVTVILTVSGPTSVQHRRRRLYSYGQRRQVGFSASRQLRTSAKRSLRTRRARQRSRTFMSASRIAAMRLTDYLMTVPTDRGYSFEQQLHIQTTGDIFACYPVSNVIFE